MSRKKLFDDSKFIGMRVPTSVVEEIDKRAGYLKRAEYVRAAIAEKLERDSEQPVA